MIWWQKILETTKQIVRSVTAGIRRLTATVREWCAAATTAAKDAAERHRDRVHTDRAYSRTVSAAVSELIATLVPSPSLATAVGVTLAGLLVPTEEDTSGYPPPGRYDPEPDYRDSYPVARRSTAPPTAGSLWDRLQ